MVDNPAEDMHLKLILDNKVDLDEFHLKLILQEVEQ